MPLALALDALAARLAGTAEHADPQARAYALREAQALARPDVLIAGWGGAAESAALAAVADGAVGDDLVDALYDAPPLIDALASSVTLVETLAALYPGGPAIAAAVRGPCSLAAGLAGPDDDREEIAEAVVDLVTPLALAYGAAGAALVLVVEDAVAPTPAPHAPLVRALAHQRLDAVLVPCGGDGAGHARVAWEIGVGSDAAVADPGLWLLGVEAFAAEHARVLAASAAGTLVVGGELPESVALERLAR